MSTRASKVGCVETHRIFVVNSPTFVVRRDAPYRTVGVDAVFETTGADGCNGDVIKGEMEIQAET